tara:strand:+ start:1994 stop:2233 length:240 start_codon:yes stop_codon:yes gene_type:complete
LDSKSGIIVNELAKMTKTQGNKSLVDESIANDIASPAILVIPLNLLLAKLYDNIEFEIIHNMITIRNNIRRGKRLDLSE